MSSNATLDTTSNYLKLAYNEVQTVVRPANTIFTNYTFPLQYQSSNYTPMVLAFYTINGVRTPCPGQFDIAPTAITPNAVATISTQSNQIQVGVFGSSGDATTYTLTVEFYVLINSVLEK